MPNIKISIFNDGLITTETIVPAGQPIKKMRNMPYKEITAVETKTSQGMLFEAVASKKKIKKIVNGIEKIMSSSEGPDINYYWPVNEGLTGIVLIFISALFITRNGVDYLSSVGLPQVYAESSQNDFREFCPHCGGRITKDQARHFFIDPATKIPCVRCRCGRPASLYK